MNSAQDPFSTANYLLRKADHARWHRQLSKQHILRSQLGFGDIPPSRPPVCTGCKNYHGLAYGYSKTTRTALICGFHPYGWPDSSGCPDWSSE
ncbi:MAG TPA: hypothetical protein V6C88_01860 [Chroococcidiopsis sp.]